MKIRLALAAATCLALPVLTHSAAHAQPVTGPYVSLAGGTSLLAPVTSDLTGGGIGSGTAFSYTFKNQFRNDFAGIAGVGYGFGNGFRVELDGDYIRNTAHESTLSIGQTVPGIVSFDYSYHGVSTGAEEKYGPMLNLLYDIPVPFPVTPYIGGGVGYQLVKFNRDITQTLGFTSEVNTISTGATKGAFAFDVIAGAAYPLPAYPQLALTAEYRFMMIPGTRTYPTTFSYEGISEKFSQESSHTVTLGLRYTLFGPPAMAPATPGPMASPAPAAAKTYLVFFDWDKYSLTPRATQIIAEAASDSKSSSVTTIDVSGYTDTSGTPTYNQGLSERRAKAVAAKLVADGVPASEISIHAYGETHLLVPTGPGVREPQNRRVEIVLN